MTFLFSMLLTSFVGFLICYRGRKNLTLIETVCVSIFIGWGYFTNIVLLFSTNFPEVELNGNVLFALILVSLVAFSIPLVIIDRKTIIHSIRSIPTIMKEARLKCLSSTFYGLKSRYYLIIPAIFLALVLLNTLITFFYEINMVDPIFQWVQRGELIFLEKSVSGALNHLYGYYPLHIPILYGWAYFFDFHAVRIFYLIALTGFAFITMENIYMYSESRFASLVFTIIIIIVQLYYTRTCYPEGITNIYFSLAALYSLRYLEEYKITFILLGSFFMTMHANTRGEGLLYCGLLLVFIILISVLSKTFRTSHIIYWLLTFCLFYYIPKFNFAQAGGLNIIMHAKIIAKCFLDLFDSFGEIYKNKSLMSNYHANKLTCIITSFFAFWDSLFFDPQKTHFYNMVTSLTELVKRIRIELWVLLLLVLWKEGRSSDAIRRFTMLVVFPFISFMLLMNFLQIYFYNSPGTLVALTERGPLRYGGFISICLVFFLSTNKFTKEVFNKIEKNKVLACALNVPFLYLLLKQIY